MVGSYLGNPDMTWLWPVCDLSRSGPWPGCVCPSDPVLESGPRAAWRFCRCWQAPAPWSWGNCTETWDCVFPGAVFLCLVLLPTAWACPREHQEIIALFIVLYLHFWCWEGWWGSLLHVGSSVKPSRLPGSKRPWRRMRKKAQNSILREEKSFEVLEQSLFGSDEMEFRGQGAPISPLVTWLPTCLGRVDMGLGKVLGQEPSCWGRWWWSGFQAGTHCALVPRDLSSEEEAGVKRLRGTREMVAEEEWGLGERERGMWRDLTCEKLIWNVILARNAILDLPRLPWKTSNIIDGKVV